MGQRTFPWLPVRWIMRNRFASIEKIGRYQGPLLIIHGTEDTLIPFAMGQTLFALPTSRNASTPWLERIITMWR